MQYTVVIIHLTYKYFNFRQMDTFSLYSSTLKQISSQIFPETNETVPILNPEIIKLFTASLGLTFASQKEHEGNVCLANSHEVRPEFKETFTSKNLFDYIYAIFHSSVFREKLKENLQIDFPYIPIQTDKTKFWKLVQLGGELRKIHLQNTGITELCSININDYQLAQKWLQDRKDQELTRKDISHYQKIIMKLTETIRIVKKIDKLDI